MTADILLLAEKSAPGRAAYDAHLLEGSGASLRVPSRRAVGVQRKIRDVIEHRTGDMWEEALRARGGRVDLVLALLEQFARAPLTLRRLGVRPFAGTPIAMLACWLAEDLRAADPEQRRHMARRYTDADLVFFLSENQREIFEAAGFRSDRLVRLPFGIDPRPDLPTAPERDIPVLAVGFDRGRDYGTFFAAMKQVDAPAIVHCKGVNLQGLLPPDNVSIRGQIPYEEYRTLLTRAQVVVVPTRDLAYPTGQSVALEASAAGACVIATGTAPLREYFEHGRTALLSTVGDAEEMASHIRRALDDLGLRSELGGAARETVHARYTSEHMWTTAGRALIDHLGIDLASEREPRGES